MIPVAQINNMKNKKIPGTNRFVDLFLVYQFMKRLITPFEKWPAFKLGIIDKDGKVLIPKKNLSQEGDRAWGYFDIVCANLKKILAKIPGGKSKLGSLVAATFLFKEHATKDYTDEQLLAEDFQMFYEDAVAANATGNAIAGTEPPPNTTVVVRNQPSMIRRKKLRLK